MVYTQKLPLVCHEELGDINIKHYCQDFLNDGSSSSNIGIPNSNPYFQPWIMLLVYYIGFSGESYVKIGRKKKPPLI